MRLWKKAVVTLAASTAMLFGVASAAHAYPGPADDRMKSVPTAWYNLDNVSSTQITDFLVANNVRITDLRLATVNPLRFRVTAVSNTGSYATPSWWYVGVTSAQVGALTTQNNARLISAVKYSANLYAVVMVSNTGANYKAWGWCDTSFAGISTCLGTGNRLTNIWSYGPNQFVVIYVNNSENYGWCWYAGISRSQLNTVCPGYSTLDISVNFDNTFNVVKLAYDGNGRPADFSSLGSLVNYALAVDDRPLLAVPYITNNTVRWITALRPN